MTDEAAQAPQINPQASGAVVSSGPGGISPGTTSASVHDNPEGGRPEWLPEGVENEAGLKDYFLAQEAAKKAAGAESPSEVAAGDQTVEADPAAARTDEQILTDLRPKLKEAGGLYADPKYEPFALAFEKNGDLTTEERAKAAVDLDVPQSAVDTFVQQSKQLRDLQGVATKATQQSAAQLTSQLRTERLGIVGGEEQFGKFNEWATENLSKAQLDAYNNAPNEDTARVLLSSYADTWKRAGNGPPARDATKGKVIGAGDSEASDTPKPYASSAEQEADQGSKRYRDDPAFRKLVMNRIAVSRY